MKAAVISLGSVSSKWIVAALKKYFDQVDHIEVQELEVPIEEINPKLVYKGKILEPYDCVYARGSFRYATLLSALTTILQKSTYLPHTPDSFTIAHNKVLTHLKLLEHNVPQPRTYLAATAEAGKKILKKIAYPIVLKLPAGTHGKGVMFADSPESASSVIDTLALLDQPFLMQEYVETNGEDYRVIVVGETVVAAMKRVAAKGEKRTNIHMGGKGETVEVDSKMKQVAIATARACGAEICAVDILPSVKGPLVLEMNISPGLQGITKATGIDVAGHIGKFLFKKTKEISLRAQKVELKRELSHMQEVHGELDFKGNRILLPELVTMASKFSPSDQVVIKAKNGLIEIKKQKN